MGSLGHYFSNARELVDHLVALETDEAQEEARRQMSIFTWPTWDQVAPTVFDKIAKGHSARGGINAT